MTKQECIEKAWEDLYRGFAAREAIDSEGYVNWGDATMQDVHEHPSYLGFDPEKDVQWNGTRWRPICLRGLHDNNGWTKIESEDDLPKESGKYLWIHANGSGFYEGFFDVKWNEWAKRDQVNFNTHYRPIVTIPKPLY